MSLQAATRNQSRVADRFCVTALLAFIVPTSLAAVTDTDYWWHLRVGRDTLAAGSVPTADIYSHTATGEPWFAHEWLTEVVLAGLDGRFGYRGPTALFAVVTAGTWLLAYFHARRSRASPFVATLLVLAGYVVARPPANVRPQLVTLALVALTAYLVDAARVDERAGRRLWVLPPLFAAWANLHGGFVLGLALLAGAAVAEVITGSWRGRSFRRLLFVLLASTAATILNPRGLVLLAYPLGYADMEKHGAHLVAEWQPPALTSAQTLLLALLIAMFLGITLRRPRRDGVLQIVWLLGLAPLAFQARRHVPLCAVVLVPALAGQIAAAAPRLVRSSLTWRSGTALAAGSCLVSAIAVGTDEAPLQIARNPSTIGYPVEAVRVLATRPGGRLFNDYGWGGYLIHELYPRYRVFIDGRADLYGGRRVEDHALIAKARDGWREKLQHHGVDVAVVKSDGPIADALAREPGWREIAHGDVERVFERIR